MKQYLELMEKILTEGFDCPDRTGTGRRKIFSHTITCDLSQNKLPIITTRKINYHHAIHELIWMISGSTNIQYLKDNHVPIWNQWAVTEQDIRNFVEERHTLFINSVTKDDVLNEADINYLNEEKEAAIKRMCDQYINSIGPMYGYHWRHATDAFSKNIQAVPVDRYDINDVPSDKVMAYTLEYEILQAQVKTHEFEQGDSDIPFSELCKVSLETYIKTRHLNNFDQLGEVIRLLKKDPFNSRIVMSVWIPQYLPFNSVEEKRNVLMGKGSLAPCHVLTQFFVTPDENGKPTYLSLKMTQRSVDVALGLCTNLIFYSLLTYAVAKVVGLKPKTFIWDGNDCHLYLNHIENAKKQILLTPYEPPTIQISDDLTDLFKLKSSDFIITDYQHHPFIKYEVSK